MKLYCVHLFSINFTSSKFLALMLLNPQLRCLKKEFNLQHCHILKYDLKEKQELLNKYAKLKFKFKLLYLLIYKFDGSSSLFSL